jgi:hypothetical protein
MSTQLTEYVVNTDFAANIGNDVTKSHYFDKWTVNGAALDSDNTLTAEQIETAISAGTITVCGNWKNKISVTVVISGKAAKNASYDSWSMSGSGNSTFYVMSANMPITITGSRKAYGTISVSATNATISSKSNVSSGGWIDTEAANPYSITFTATQDCTITLS